MSQKGLYAISNLETVHRDALLRNNIINRGFHTVLTAYGYQFIAWYNEAGQVMLGRRTVDSKGDPNGLWEFATHTSKTLSLDDFHYTISLGIDDKKHLWIGYSIHGDALKIYRMANPLSISNADAQANETTFVNASNENTASYMKFFNDKYGKLLLHFRDGNANDSDWYLYKYDSDADTWSAPPGLDQTAGKQGRVLHGQAANVGFYTSFPYVDEKNVLHMFFHLSSDIGSGDEGHDIGYFSYDMKNGVVKTSNNTTQAMPITPSNYDVVDNTSAGDAVLTSQQRRVAKTSDGNLHIVYSRNDAAGNHNFFYSVYDKSKWTTVQISNFRERQTGIHAALLVDKEDNLYLVYRNIEGAQGILCMIKPAHSDTWVGGSINSSGTTGNIYLTNIDYKKWDDYNTLSIFLQRGNQNDFDYLTGSRPVDMLTWKPKDGLKAPPQFLETLFFGTEGYFHFENGSMIINLPTAHNHLKIFTVGEHGIIMQCNQVITSNQSERKGGAITQNVEYINNGSTNRTIGVHVYRRIMNPVLTENGSGQMNLTDAAADAYDANPGTHKALDSGSTKATPGGVDAWEKVSVNGTIYYRPLFTSKTS